MLVALCERHHAGGRIQADRRRAGRIPRTGRAPRCMPARPNASAVLPGTSLAVSPLPGSYDASPYTQISLLGAPRGRSATCACTGLKTGSHSGRLRGYSQGDGASFVPSRPFRSGETVTVRGTGQTGLARSGDSPSSSWSPRPIDLRYRSAHPAVGQRPPRDAAFPLAPGSEAAGDRRQRALAAERPRGPVRRALRRAGPGRADDPRRSRQPRVVRSAPGQHRGDQPAGAAVRRAAGADLVAGIHPAAGIRRGRRDDREQLLPPRSAAFTRATATKPTCTTSTSLPRERRC